MALDQCMMMMVMVVVVVMMMITTAITPSYLPQSDESDVLTKDGANEGFLWLL